MPLLKRQHTYYRVVEADNDGKSGDGFFQKCAKVEMYRYYLSLTAMV